MLPLNTALRLDPHFITRRTAGTPEGGQGAGWDGYQVILFQVWQAAMVATGANRSAARQAKGAALHGGFAPLGVGNDGKRSARARRTSKRLGLNR